MARWLRLVVVLMVAATTAATIYTWLDLLALAGRPSPGFPLFSNAVISFPLLEIDPTAGLRARLPPFDRVVAVDGEVVASGAEVRAHAARAGAGAVFAYTLEGPDGTRRVEHVAVQRPSRADLWRVYGPFLAVGAVLLAVGTIAVLVRPGLAATRLVFAFTAGLAIPMGLLVPDHFEVYRLSPWLRCLAFAAPPALLQLALLFPRRLALLRRAPRAVPIALYAGSALLLAVHLWAFFHDAALLRSTAWLLLAMLIAGFALLAANLAVSALRAPTALERQQARVVLPGPIAMVLGLTVFAAANALQLRIHPALQLLPNVVIAACLTYAMLARNVFEFDATVRRALSAAVLALLGVATYFFLYASMRSLLGVDVAWASTAATAALVLLAVPAIGSARTRADRLVETLLFPSQRAGRELLEATAAELDRLRGSDELMRFLRDTLHEALGCETLRLLTGAPDRPLVEIAPRDAAQSLELAPADPLYVAIRRGVAFAPAADAATDRSGPSGPARRRVAGLGAALVVPLAPTPHSIGALLLGDRRDGRLYTQDDERLVATLASQASTALDNAQALESLRRLEARLSAENVRLREDALLDPELGELLGRSAALQHVIAQVRKVAPTNASVLVQGETGTGKELVARAIHSLGARRDRALVQVACAALPEALLESELFGYEKGAFTGADARKAGRLEIADGGTLFLDDVDTLPLGVQAKLLRALQEGELQKLGSERIVRVDLRVVAATNRDLLAEVRAGRFREDLYYRLCVIPIAIPPLRERREDVSLLAAHFVRLHAAKLGRAVNGIAAETIAELEAYDWPGNVRELRNVIERALVMAQDDVLRLPAPLRSEVSPHADLGGNETAPEVGSAPMPELLARYRRALVEAALAQAGGNQGEAARLLGLHRQSFARMLRDAAGVEEEL